MAARDLSPAMEMANLPLDQQKRLLSRYSEEQQRALRFDWGFWGRSKQQPPDWLWTVWLLLCGRGFGKTRTGAEQVRCWAESGQVRYITLVGPTADDIRDALVEGESGLVTITPPWVKIEYEPSKRRITWPNGCRAMLISADEPDRFRNKQHEKVWADEVAAWRYPEAWDMMMMGLRLGRHPQVVATTTPRPTPLIRELRDNALGLGTDGKPLPEGEKPYVALTVGSTFENSENLAPAFQQKVVKKYEGTRLGRQELEAEILADTAGALWTDALLEAAYVAREPEQFLRLVTAVDPSVAADGDRDECGIGIAGIAMCDCLVRKGKAQKPELHGFVLEDLTDNLSPAAWLERVIRAYVNRKCDRVIAEVNNGGALVETALRGVTVDVGGKIVSGSTVAYEAVHASQGKRTRAEPVAALYEQGKVHHIGRMAKLESELTTWVPKSGMKSPNRLDWLVWALTYLMLGEPVEESTASYWARMPAQKMGR